MFVGFGEKRKNVEKILKKGFDEILDSFDSQGMPNDLYENYHSLIAPIETVLAEPDISDLDNLVRSFVQIQPL